jgi:hypothetical protein
MVSVADAAMVAILNNLVFEHVFCACRRSLNVDATTVGTVVCGSHDECCKSLPGIKTVWWPDAPFQNLCSLSNLPSAGVSA